MARMSKEKQGMLLLVVCSLLWSISGVMIKGIPWEAPVIAGFRSLFAGGVMAVYIRVSGMRFRVSRVSAVTAVTMSCMFLCFTLANKLTTAANAIVIQASSPVFVLLYNVIAKKQRARRLDVLTVVLTFIGISLFFLEQMDGGMLLGNLIALFSGVLLAATYITTYAAKPEERMNGILLSHLLTALIGIPFAFVTPFSIAAAPALGVLVLGVVQLGIPYMLFGLAVQHCPPLACSLIGMLEAVFNPIWVFLYTGERPSFLSLLGGVLVLASIAYWAIHSQGTPVRSEAPTEA